MKNLNLFFERALNTVEDAGIEAGNIIDVVINTRAKSRWGRCKRVVSARDWKDCKFTIEINNELLQDFVPDYGLEETLIHEILHSCRGCMNHGPVWQNYVSIINKKFGYSIKQADTAADKGIDTSSENYLKLHYKYQITCDQCGATTYLHRKLRNPLSTYQCAKCGCKKLNLKILH